MLAIIPTINRSTLLDKLIDVLVGDGVRVVVVDGCDTPTIAAREGVGVLWRPSWGIYRTWNFGLDLGQANDDDCVFVLNDDIIIDPGTVQLMAHLLKASSFGIIGFHDLGGLTDDGTRKLADTTRSAASGDGHEIAGYAFAANPFRCARCDERFVLYCGDDDLFQATATAGARVGTAYGINVKHPNPRTSSADVDVRFPGWYEHDMALMAEKWGAVIHGV